jgi:NTP pyrophosphatase (non-canonical NTP hydrolase)
MNVIEMLKRKERLKMKSLNKLIKEIGKWDEQLFGRHALGKANHLKKEVNELIDAIKNGDICMINYEAADIFILLAGITEELYIDLPYYVTEKMKINKTRSWHKPDKDGVVEHIKRIIK